jgi:KaiC/GvpD/RAD55 family RecA-like ATPase
MAATQKLIERVKTGIPGLDGILHGGFIRGTNIVISGGVGTGKSIFSMQFLVAGAEKYNEAGVLVTLEEKPSELRREAAQFGWNLEQLESESNRKLIIIDAASSKAGLPSSEEWALRRGFDLNTLAQEIYKATKSINAQRIAVDSLSGLGLRIESSSEVRGSIFKLSALLRELGVTSIMTSEILSQSVGLSRYGVEEFVAQGLIVLSLEEDHGELRRSMVIRKMRATAHSLKRFPFEISSKGIVVMPSGEL